MASIRLNNVSKRYSKTGKLIVDQINLSIDENEFLVLVGPSGCGKTTTLRMIAGLESITGGEILIGERRVNDLAPKDRNVSLVFQNYALYPHLNVFGNLAFGLKMQKKSKEEMEQKVCEIAKMLELSEYLKRKPGELSGGQRQRVALGRALIRETEVMLMDEPLSNLDAKLRVQTRAEILSLHKKMKRTVVYVTHDQVEAMTMGDRVAVMYDGVIQQLGTPEEVYQKPANLFVAGFIGTPSMNFLEGGIAERLRKGAGGAVILGIRPEDIEILPAADRRADFSASLDVIENLGAEQQLTLSAGAQEITVKSVKKAVWSKGAEVGLMIDKDKIHVFDKETGRRLSS